MGNFLFFYFFSCVGMPSVYILENLHQNFRSHAFKDHKSMYLVLVCLGFHNKMSNTGRLIAKFIFYISEGWSLTATSLLLGSGKDSLACRPLLLLSLHAAFLTSYMLWRLGRNKRREGRRRGRGREKDRERKTERERDTQGQHM